MRSDILGTDNIEMVFPEYVESFRDPQPSWFSKKFGEGI